MQVSDDGNADGSTTTSPGCKRKRAQSFNVDAAQGAKSTATATKQSSGSCTCVLVGETSGEGRPLRDWHRALFAILLGQWHYTLAYPGTLSKAKAVMLQRGGSWTWILPPEFRITSTLSSSRYALFFIAA